MSAGHAFAMHARVTPKPWTVTWSPPSLYNVSITFHFSNRELAGRGGIQAHDHWQKNVRYTERISPAVVAWR